MTCPDLPSKIFSIAHLGMLVEKQDFPISLLNVSPNIIVEKKQITLPRGRNVSYFSVTEGGQDCNIKEVASPFEHITEVKPTDTPNKFLVTVPHFIEYKSNTDGNWHHGADAIFELELMVDSIAEY